MVCTAGALIRWSGIPKAQTGFAAARMQRSSPMQTGENRVTRITS